MRILWPIIFLLLLLPLLLLCICVATKILFVDLRFYSRTPPHPLAHVVISFATQEQHNFTRCGARYVLQAEAECGGGQSSFHLLRRETQWSLLFLVWRCGSCSFFLSLSPSPSCDWALFCLIKDDEPPFVRWHKVPLSKSIQCFVINCWLIEQGMCDASRRPLLHLPNLMHIFGWTLAASAPQVVIVCRFQSVIS